MLPILGRVETELRRTFQRCVREPSYCKKYADAYNLCAITTRRKGKLTAADPACVNAFGIALPVFKQLLSAAHHMYARAKVDA